MNGREMNRQTNEKQTNARTQRNRTQQTNRWSKVKREPRRPKSERPTLWALANSQKPNEQQKNEQPNEPKAK